MAGFRRLLHPVTRSVLKLLRRAGYDVVRRTPEAVLSANARARWIEKLGVDLVIDVGANRGQFVGWIRERGYHGRILSFEPQRNAFEACVARWQSDKNWTGLCLALGESDGEMTMQMAGNSVSSSLLPMLDSHVEALPESAVVASEAVTVKRLDEAIPSVLGGASRLYLKLDVQGFEHSVLRGAKGILDRVVVLEIELSLVPLYAGQALLPEMMNEVAALGFTPIALEPGFTSSLDGRLLQMDGLFVRTTLL